MVKKSEFFGFFPLRGVLTERFDVGEIWQHPWAIISGDQIADLNALFADSAGENLDLIKARLKPDSFLTVRRYLDPEMLSQSWSDIAKIADRIVAALNFSALLSGDS